MRVALTGASGHLGSLVLLRLVADPQVSSIVALDLMPPWLHSRKLYSCTVDIADSIAVREAISGCDTVVHMAFNVDRPDAPERMFETNVTGTRAVAAACRDAGVGRIVYVSSGAVYGFSDDRPVQVDEAVPAVDTPGFLYAHHKWLGERALMDAFDGTPNIGLAILRPAICIGPHAKTAFAALMRKRTIVCIEDTPLQVLWDEDLAAAVHAAVHARAAGAFNVAAGEPLRYSEIAKVIGGRYRRIPAAIALASIRVKNVLARLGLVRAVEEAWVKHAPRAPDLVADRARRELGWSPQFPTCRDALEHFAETVPVPNSRRLARLLGGSLSEGRSPVSDESPFKVNVHLTGRDGGDVTVKRSEGRYIWSNGRARGADAVVRVPFAVFEHAVLSGETSDLVTASEVWSDDVEVVRQVMLEGLGQS